MTVKASKMGAFDGSRILRDPTAGPVTYMTTTPSVALEYDAAPPFWATANGLDGTAQVVIDITAISAGSHTIEVVVGSTENDMTSVWSCAPVAPGRLTAMVNTRDLPVTITNQLLIAVRAKPANGGSITFSAWISNGTV